MTMSSMHSMRYQTLHVEQRAMAMTVSSQHKKRYYMLHVEPYAMTMNLSSQHKKRYYMLHVERTMCSDHDLIFTASTRRSEAACYWLQVGVAEFLQDIMGMDGQQVFKCFHEEPSVLYLDVYNDLMPMQGFFDALDWQPAHYVQMIVK
jgi:hypothetical protein